jgi:hypothetical protein
VVIVIIIATPWPDDVLLPVVAAAAF